MLLLHPLAGFWDVLAASLATFLGTTRIEACYPRHCILTPSACARWFLWLTTHLEGNRTLKILQARKYRLEFHSCSSTLKKFKFPLFLK